MSKPVAGCSQSMIRGRVRPGLLARLLPAVIIALGLAGRAEAAIPTLSWSQQVRPGLASPLGLEPGGPAWLRDAGFDRRATGLGSMSPQTAASGTPTQDVDGTSQLTSVACPSTSSCLAVGEDQSGAGVVVPINNGVAGTPNDSGEPMLLGSIACTGPDTCVAVGANASATEGLVVPVEDGVPGTPELVPGTGVLQAVACDPSGACVAVGEDDQFAAGVVVPITAGSPGAVQPVPSAGPLYGVACPSDGSCSGVGYSPDFSSGSLVPITNGTAGAANTIDSAQGLFAIGCANQSSCTATGVQPQSSTNLQLVAVPVVDGSAGTAQSTVGVPGEAEIAIFGLAVACPSAQLCLSVGSSNGVLNAAIAPIVNGAPSIGQDVTGSAFLGGIACPSATRCLAVGGTLDGRGTVMSFPAGTAAGAATRLSVTPATTRFGQTVTATATVSSAAGVPVGEVFFGVDGVIGDYPQPLDRTGRTTFTIRGLAPGTHSVTAYFVGQPGPFTPGTYYQAGDDTGSTGVGCAATITGSESGNISITRTATCLSGAEISGSVTVAAGAAVSIDASTIHGSVEANGAGTLRMCGTSVGGNVNVVRSRGYVLVGDGTPGFDLDNCDHNTIGSSLVVASNDSGATAVGNEVGGRIDLADDSGRGGFPFELAPRLAPNTLSSTGATTDLAPRNAGSQGEPIDGIGCDSSEQLVTHYHAHLAIFAGGQPQGIPAGIGIAGDVQVAPSPYGGFSYVQPPGCFYWVHVHDPTGMIHMELPANVTVTLGDFFDIWGQPLSSNQVGPQHGPVTAFVNGRLFVGNPRSIVLGDHTLVQLDVGAPIVPPQPFKFVATNR